MTFFGRRLRLVGEIHANDNYKHWIKWFNWKVIRNWSGLSIYSGCFRGVCLEYQSVIFMVTKVLFVYSIGEICMLQSVHVHIDVFANSSMSSLWPSPIFLRSFISLNGSRHCCRNSNTCAALLGIIPCERNSCFISRFISRNITKISKNTMKQKKTWKTLNRRAESNIKLTEFHSLELNSKEAYLKLQELLPEHSTQQFLSIFIQKRPKTTSQAYIIISYEPIMHVAWW